MPLIHSPPAAPNKDTLALRLDRDLHSQLRVYAEFLQSTKEYIVTSALRRVFRHDKEFIAWQQARQAPAPQPAVNTGPVDESSRNDARRRTAADHGQGAHVRRLLEWSASPSRRRCRGARRIRSSCSSRRISPRSTEGSMSPRREDRRGSRWGSVRPAAGAEYRARRHTVDHSCERRVSGAVAADVVRAAGRR